MKKLILSLLILISISSFADTVSVKDVAVLNMLKLYQEHIHYVMDDQNKSDKKDKKTFLRMVNNEIDRMQIRDNLALLYIDKKEMCSIANKRVTSAGAKYSRAYAIYKQTRINMKSFSRKHKRVSSKHLSSIYGDKVTTSRIFNYNKDLQKYICNQF